MAGAFGREPSVGVGSVGAMAGDNWADPKMYEMKEWSSRPQTPWEPAGSKVYVSIKRRISRRYLDEKSKFQRTAMR